MSLKRKHGSASDEESAPSSSSKEHARIHGLYEKVLRTKLDKLVKDDNKDALNMLATLFPACDYPPIDEAQAHCVYCHKNFDERDTSSCVMEHTMTNCDRVSKDSSGSSWCGSCDLCGEGFEGNSNSYDEPPYDMGRGYCYKGPHSSHVKDLQVIMEWSYEKYEAIEIDCAQCQEHAEKLEEEIDDEEESSLEEGAEVIDLSADSP